MKSADHIIDEVLQAEGGYVNDPRDRGGETNWGITVADNYKTCHATAEQLIALQDWIRRREAINDHATGQ